MKTIQDHTHAYRGAASMHLKQKKHLIVKDSIFVFSSQKYF